MYLPPVFLIFSFDTHSLKAQTNKINPAQIETLKWTDLDNVVTLMRHCNNEARKEQDMLSSAHLTLEISKMNNRERRSNSIRKWHAIALELFAELRT